MLKYKKLPKNTPHSVVLGILFIGFCLSYSIVATGLVAVYGLIGLFGGYFYYGSSIIISMHEAWYLGMLVLVSSITCVMLSFLAYYMNTLSKKTYSLSRVMSFPAILTTFAVLAQNKSSVFTYHISTPAVLAVSMIILFGGLFPALFLSTKAARKVHNQ